jgi:hypothetical protein
MVKLLIKKIGWVQYKPGSYKAIDDTFEFKQKGYNLLMCLILEQFILRQDAKLGV